MEEKERNFARSVGGGFATVVVLLGVFSTVTLAGKQTVLFGFKVAFLTYSKQLRVQVSH